MRLLSKTTLSLAAVAALAPSALGFSLLGPYLTTLGGQPFEVRQLGYAKTNDIGGPMFLHSFYRWNVTNVYYAFDQSFINYFGTNGMKAVDDAFAILNDLPPASKIDLNNYPPDTKLWNPQAEAADLMDVKSTVLSLLVEHLGLAEPERYAWTLAHRFAAGNNTNYYVMQMNYDPFTFQPTPWVNDVLYTYQIQEDNNGNAEAVEVPVTFNDRLPFTSVAGGNLAPGYFYTGLSRDDVGGIKFLLSTNTLCVETLLPSITRGNPTFTSFGWVPYQGTTNTVTNSYFSTNASVQASLTNASNFLTVGIRGGVGKLHFTRTNFMDLLSTNFAPVTDYWNDVLIITNKIVTQPLQRPVTQPDIVFVAEDLGFSDIVINNTGFIVPNLTTRSDTTTWINDDVMNGQTAEGGPGLITGPVVIRLTTFNLGGNYNENPFFLNEQWSTTGSRWASFDNSGNPPFIYPVYETITVEQLLDMMSQFSTPTNR